ncbi:MAG TPA: ABC transporter permease [Ktedonobacteraceae bacterium]|nr:ABC transporter permease [Ktedonobacteraceae bacterium]
MRLYSKTRQHVDTEKTQKDGGASPSVHAGSHLAPRKSLLDKSRRRRWLRTGAPVGFILPIAVILFWQFASVAGWIDQNLLPAPTTVAATTVGLIRDGTLGSDLLASGLRWIVGFLIGGTLGLLVGSLVGLSRIAERVLDTSVQMLRTIPFLALAPLLVLWLGLDEPPKITLIALASFFPLYLNTFAGIRNVDRKLIEIGQIYRLSQPEMLMRVILPAALPEILTGVRYALAVAWLALVLAELLGAQQGLGYLLSEGREFVRVDIVLCSILIFAIVGKLVDVLVRGLEVSLLRWRDTYKG